MTIRSFLTPFVCAFVLSLPLACGSASSSAPGDDASLDAALTDAASQRTDGAPSQGDSGVSTDAGASAADSPTGADAAASADAAAGDATVPGCTTAADCDPGKLCISRPNQACSPALNPHGCAALPSTCVDDPCAAGGTGSECVCASSLCSGYSGCAFTQDAGVVNCIVGG